MWKKFLAVTALTGLLSTSVYGSSITDEPLDPPVPAREVIDELSVSQAAFNPTGGEQVTINLELAEPAEELYLYAVDSGNRVVAIFADHVPSVAGADYVWHGTSGNLDSAAALSDGTYTVKAFVFEEDGTVVGFASQAVQIVSETLDLPVVAGLSADPLTFSAAEGGDTEISFAVNQDAFLKVEIFNFSAARVRSFVAYDGNDWYRSTASHSINWNGTNDAGAVVADGTYKVVVTAANDNGEVSDDVNVTVTTVGVVSRGMIRDLTLDPSDVWDPVEEELEIEFELTSEASSLTVEAKRGGKLIEILDDTNVDDDDYQEFWDGTDDDGDLVDAGEWEIVVRADGDKVSKKVIIAYEEPGIVDALVTKSSFDPREGEFTTLLFKVDTVSQVTVEVFKGSSKELTLWEEQPVSKNRWYALAWDGREGGDDVSYGKDWKFKITAENPVDDDIEDVETVEVDIEEDEVSEKKSNVTGDYTIPAVYDKDFGGPITVNYCLDLAADVYLAVYDGTSTSGKPEIELLNYVPQSVGCHTAQWNGTDEKGKTLDDDIYSYKIISRATGNKKETELGKFVVGRSADTFTPVPPYDVPPTGGDCGGYSDTKYLGGSDEMCLAIDFVTAKGIFNGYDDGNFGPYNNITRAEVLKVVLRAFSTRGLVSILSVDGSNHGFPDVNPDAWYMPYVRTAKLYGMIHGYTDGEAKLDRSVSRVELLKFALEAAGSFAGYEIPHYTTSNYADVAVGEWFADYAGAAYAYKLFNEFFDSAVGKYSLHPHAAVERGEAALLLYRMSNNGLLDSSSGSTGSTAAYY